MSRALRLEPPPVRSTAPSTAAEVASSEALRGLLDAVAPLEPDVRRQRREELLLELTALLRDWICLVAVNKQRVTDMGAAREAGFVGSIQVSGSYKLGVATADSDIDTVCLLPDFVAKGDFFTGFYDLLKAHPAVTELLAIPDARVPIIALEFHGIAIDLQHVILPVSTARSLDILDDKVLSGLQPAGVLSLNGPRLNELLFHLVPEFETFKVVLRALRLWGKARGLYSNKFGFLGGVNFALLAGYTCQLYPNLAPAAVLAKFFETFKDWPWPKPVKMNEPYKLPELGLDVWDPVVNGKEVMPILTPVYPAYNSATSASRATLAIMVMELQVGGCTRRGAGGSVSGSGGRRGACDVECARRVDSVAWTPQATLRAVLSPACAHTYTPLPPSPPSPCCSAGTTW
jgi:poly(A) polymerase